MRPARVPTQSFRMRFRRLWPFGLLALALASTGCNGGRKNPPDAVVRVLNATANYPALTFWRGAVQARPTTQPLQVDFLGGDQAAWDEDTYNFHVTYLDLQTQNPVEVDSFTIPHDARDPAAHGTHLCCTRRPAS